MAYLRRRLLHSIFLVLGVSVLAFVLCEMAPGDFFDEMRLNPSVSRETVDGMRAQYGVDQPLAVRYGRWLGSALRGEFGFSLAYNAPIGPLVWERAKNTLLLTVTATALGWLIAVPLAVWTAHRRGKWDDRVCAAGTSALLCVPDLLLALGLMYLAVQTGWFPTGGMMSVGFGDLSLIGKIRDLAWHFVLPVTALVLGILPALVRHSRAAVGEAMQSPAIAAARAHGIAPVRLLFRYALPAAANPLITLAGLTIGNLLGASLLIEVVMSWPGLGPLLLEAILARDLLVVIGITVFSTMLLAIGNLLTDYLLYAADPRIRVEAR
ncbi:MAG: ABC transporter permease [Candidatus Acidiferrales bacterium]